MTEAFYDFFSMILGRYFFGLIGATLRYSWMRVTGKNVRFTDVWESRGDEHEIDREGFKSRIVGFVTVLALVLLAVG